MVRATNEMVKGERGGRQGRELRIELQKSIGRKGIGNEGKLVENVGKSLVGKRGGGGGRKKSCITREGRKRKVSEKL